jgi:hypothetical protein
MRENGCYVLKVLKDGKNEEVKYLIVDIKAKSVNDLFSYSTSFWNYHKFSGILKSRHA